MTEEGMVKAKVNKVLAKYPVYKFWPVQMGMGSRTLDMLGCINGRFFAIETKAPGNHPTRLQLIAIREIEKVGGTCFVIDRVDDPRFDDLLRFLDDNSNHSRQ